MYLTQKHATNAVGAVLDGQTLSHAFTSLWRQEPNLRPQQRGAIQDICYGTLRQLGLLQKVLESLLNKPMYEPSLHALLLVSLYQLYFTRAAPYTIVDHAVKVAAHTGTGKGKGLVNAILRNFLRQRTELVAAAQHTQLGRWSHPIWWISAMQKAYPSEWEALLTTSNRHPPMTLRINHRHGSCAAYQARLKEAGIDSHMLDETALLLKYPAHVDLLPGFFDGDASVQDWGAQHAARLLDVEHGMRVLDACAAPGGKTGHLLELADIDLTALDVDAKRLELVTENLQRLGLTATLKVGDATDLSTWWDGKPFDRILADVPCSATGVARRHPDIKWLRRPEDFANFAQQQAKMLDALWPLVAPGGKLLYATCSIFPAENSEQAIAFAERHQDAERLSLALPGDGQLLPSPEHDGFFYALFSKRST